MSVQCHNRAKAYAVGKWRSVCGHVVAVQIGCPNGHIGVVHCPRWENLTGNAFKSFKFVAVQGCGVDGVTVAAGAAHAAGAAIGLYWRGYYDRNSA